MAVARRRCLLHVSMPSFVAHVLCEKSANLFPCRRRGRARPSAHSRSAARCRQGFEQRVLPTSLTLTGRTRLPPFVWSVVPKIGCAPVFGANVCDAPGAAFVRSGRLALVVGGGAPTAKSIRRDRRDRADLQERPGHRKARNTCSGHERGCSGAGEPRSDRTVGRGHVGIG